MKISTPITKRKDRWRSIEKQLQYSNKKLFPHGVFKGRLKFLGLIYTHTYKAMYMQLASSIVFKYIFSKLTKIGNKSFIIPLL